MLVDPRTFRRVVDVRAELVAGTSLSVRDLAERTGLSTARLIRVFAAVFGTTPHQLRTEARLIRARARLARGAAVTEVCMELGYASVGSFSALFTRWTGVAPSRYRVSVQVPGPAPAPLIPGCFGLLTCAPGNFREARVR